MDNNQINLSNPVFLSEIQNLQTKGEKSAKVKVVKDTVAITKGKANKTNDVQKMRDLKNISKECKEEKDAKKLTEKEEKMLKASFNEKIDEGYEKNQSIFKLTSSQCLEICNNTAPCKPQNGWLCDAASQSSGIGASLGAQTA
jgi:hypothetical protein